MSMYGIDVFVLAQVKLRKARSGRRPGSPFSAFPIRTSKGVALCVLGLEEPRKSNTSTRYAAGPIADSHSAQLQSESDPNNSAEFGNLLTRSSLSDPILKFKCAPGKLRCGDWACDDWRLICAAWTFACCATLVCGA